MLIDLRERRREEERKGEKHLCERETSIGCLSHAPGLEMEPAAPACSLAVNQTGNLSVYETTLQLSHMGQGVKSNFWMNKQDLFTTDDFVYAKVTSE